MTPLLASAYQLPHRVSRSSFSQPIRRRLLHHTFDAWVDSTAGSHQAKMRLLLEILLKYGTKELTGSSSREGILRHSGSNHLPPQLRLRSSRSQCRFFLRQSQSTQPEKLSLSPKPNGCAIEGWPSSTHTKTTLSTPPTHSSTGTLLSPSSTPLPSPSRTPRATHLPASLSLLKNAIALSLNPSHSSIPLTAPLSLNSPTARRTHSTQSKSNPCVPSPSPSNPPFRQTGTLAKIAATASTDSISLPMMTVSSSCGSACSEARRACS
ncbi:hypothetical protein JOL62DRAFT_52441 [Phyllosticta paracitricarpa]|uniref:Uncharacterized protein n=1 Tax=Phyllosticta paracitricarpa TaxID=2016321 RepID=A0ABR1NBU9_9PEZI